MLGSVRAWLTRSLWHAVRRDRFTRSAAEEGRQLQLCQYMWWVRHVVVAAALVLWGRGSFAGTPLAPVVALACLQVVGHTWSHLRPERASTVSVVDAVAVMALTTVGLSPLVVLVVLVAVLGWAATFRPVPAVGAYLAVVVTVLIMHQRVTSPDPHVVLVAFCLLGAVFMLRTIRLNMGTRRAAERERLVGERVDAVFWEEVPGTDGLKVSAAAERLLGYPDRTWERRGFWREVIHPDDQGLLMADGLGPAAPAAPAAPVARADPADPADPAAPADPADPDAGVTGGTRRLVRVRHRNGTWRWMDCRTGSVVDRNGRPAFHVGVLVDRTEQVEAEREALAFGRLVTLSPIGQLLLGCAGGTAVVEALNPACAAALGVPALTAGSHWPQEPESSPVRAVASLIEAALRDGRANVEFAGADGRTYQADGQRVGDANCKIDLIDVTERVRARERLDALARRDDLTGLPNRRAFNEFLAERTASGVDGHTALLILDLDRFKEINDSLGHVVGDGLLREVAERISGCVGSTGFVARLGGDEFAVVMPGTGAERAAQQAGQLAEAVTRPIDIAGLRLRTRASIGLAVHPDDAGTADELVRRADVAMYQAKHQAGDPQRYDATRDFFRGDSVTLISDLDGAIHHGDLLLHHQPLFALATDALVGTEALVRWQHPSLGLIPPARFIELADAAGHMRALTRWVIRTALADLRHLQTSLGGPLDVSVNLSVRNLYEQDFVEWLDRTLTEEGVDGRQVVVEITESTVMGDYDLAASMLESLGELGVRTWIDDFGTGYSSLARLRNLPVHGVKIDRSFVTHAAFERGDRRLLRNLIRLVRDLGLQTIAEGIEDCACLELLRDLGCDLAQGYYLGRPAPVATLLTTPSRLRVPQRPDSLPRQRTGLRRPSHL